MDDTVRARALAEGVLRDLRLVESGWHIESLSTTSNSPPPRPGLKSAAHILIEASSSTTEARIQAHFTTTVPHSQACVATAEQIQDQAIEIAHGEPLPRCPEHGHPAVARVLESQPSWVCPKDSTHFAIAISGS